MTNRRVELLIRADDQPLRGAQDCGVRHCSEDEDYSGIAPVSSDQRNQRATVRALVIYLGADSRRAEF